MRLAVSVGDLRKDYVLGGETVHASARRFVRRARGRLHLDHGAERFGQEHAAQLARLSRSAVGGQLSCSAMWTWPR